MRLKINAVAITTKQPITWYHRKLMSLNTKTAITDA
jgi:hypothetical protein